VPEVRVYDLVPFVHVAGPSASSALEDADGHVLRVAEVKLEG
jgi:hypothetical protein